MTSDRDRLSSPPSIHEMERRWSAVRAGMAEVGVDALVLQGANNMAASGGYFRWLTGISVPDSYPTAVIFPRHDLMTLVSHGPFNGRQKLDGNDPAWPGVGLKLTTPALPAIEYTVEYEADLVLAELAKAQYRKIGYVGPNQIYFGFGNKMRKALGDGSFVDVTDMIDPIKAIKSPEEIELLRQTAVMQDNALQKTLPHIRSGQKDFEVMAYSHYLSEMMGSATGFFLGSSASPGEPALIRTRPNQGRALRDGDVMFWQAENTGLGGLFVHMGRFLVLGKAPQQLVEMHEQACEAQKFTLTLLEPGASASEVFQEYQSYLRSRGIPEETRLHCHAQGYDLVERPLVRADETMKLAANTNMGVHPAWMQNNAFITVCDNFLVHKDHVERLHKTPQKIFEL